MARTLPLDIDWVTCAAPDCRGAVCAPYDRCMAHLDAAELDSAVRALSPGSGLDLRGVVIDARLLGRVMAALDDGRGRARMGRARFERAEFACDARFCGAVFEGDASFGRARFDRLATFYGARFAGNVAFCEVRFARELSFHDVTVAGHAAFERIVVARDALFGESRFGRTVSFRGARFDGFAAFDQAVFAAGASFRGVRFERAASFRKAVFQGPAGFEATRFGARTYLSPASAGCGLALTGARAAGSLDVQAHGCAIDLRAAQVTGPLTLRLTDGEADLEGTVLRGGGTLTGRGSARVLSLRGVEAERLTLTGVDLSACRFSGLRHPEGVSLSGCVFPTTPKGVRVGLRWPPLRWSSPRRVLADENDWRDWRERQDRRRTRDRQDKRDKRDKRDGRGTRDRRGRRERDLARAEEALSGVRPPAAPPPSAAEELAFLYRGLSKALDDAHTADDFAFGAMEVRRLTSLGAGRWLLAAYWLVCGYGLRMRRALGWSALIAAVAAGFVMVTSASHAVRAPARPSPSSVRTPEVLQGTSVPASPVLGDDYRDGSG